MESPSVMNLNALFAVVTLSQLVGSSFGGVITCLPESASPPCESCGSAADGVSADGQIVVGSCAGRAVVWRADGGLLNLGSLGVGGSFATAVSADGSVIVGSTDSPDGQRAFRWTASTGLVSLGILEGNQWSQALAISGDGATTVGMSALPVIWTAFGQCLAVGGLTTSDRIAAISANGSVLVGGFSQQDFPWGSTLLALRWTVDRGGEALGLLPGDHGAMANGVAGDGSVIVGASYRFEGGVWRRQAVVWDAAGIRRVATPTWATESELQGVSASGRVGVGILVNSGESYGVAAVWHEFAGLVPLRDLLQAQGADLTGWILTDANAVSADGRVVVGTGMYFGRQRAFRAEIGSFDDAGTADLNFNGSVDGADLGIILAGWGEPGRTDLTRDGTTDGADLGLLLNAWGSCPN